MQLLAASEVACRLGVSRSTLQRLRACGEIPEPLKLGPKLIRWRLEDLEAWAQKRLVRS